MPARFEIRAMVGGQRQGCPRRGFTLVEVLVVLSIIGILLGLLLPAIQMVRAAARRTECSHNLRQLAIAMHSYHELHRSLPRFVANDDSRAASARNLYFDSWMWGASVMPFVEGGSLHDRIDFNAPPMSQPNKSIVETPVAVFRCPSETAPIAERFREAETFDPITVPLANHGMNMGVPHLCRFSQVRDGLSNSLLLGESVASTSILPAPDNFRLHAASNWSCFLMGFKRFEDVYLVGAFVDYSSGIRSPNEISMFNTASSYHPGGAHATMFDGSVHFLSTSLDEQTLQALAEIDDGRPVGNFAE